MPLIDNGANMLACVASLLIERAVLAGRGANRQSADFDFARYACLVTDRQILSMANPPLWSWAVLILAHWLTYGIREAFNLHQ